MNILPPPSTHIAVMIASLPLLGCDASQQPLIFGSSNILGVDLSVSPSNTQPLTLSLGYKGNDFSVVPVTSVPTSGVANPIRGCFTTDPGTACPADGQGGVKGASNTDSIAQAKRTTSPEPPLSALLTAFNAPAPPVPPTLAAPKSNTGDTNNALIPQGLPGSGGQASMRDALSVYSSFNTGVGASGGVSPQTPGNSGSPTSATINLGKVFATGVAAQFLSYGQYSFFQSSASTACIKQLADALKDQLKEDTLVKICGPSPSAK